MVKLYEVNPMSDEDDLCTFGHVHEVFLVDDIDHVFNKAIYLKFLHVYPHLAGLKFGA